MAHTDLITAVDQALAALKVARKALVADAKQARGVKVTSTTKKAAAPKPAGKGMSEDGRRRVAEAQRKRWALVKRAAKKAARQAGK